MHVREVFASLVGAVVRACPRMWCYDRWNAMRKQCHERLLLAQAAGPQQTGEAIWIQTAFGGEPLET